MSMHSYRRDERSALRVPVVLPQLDVDVDDEGRLTARLNGERYFADGLLQRGDLQRVVTEIAAELQSAVRVDVREADGARFIDIVTPPVDESSAKLAAEASNPVSVGPAAGQVSRSGFRPGDQIAVVVVVASVVADASGTARFRLPPALGTSREVLFVSREDRAAVDVA